MKNLSTVGRVVYGLPIAIFGLNHLTAAEMMAGIVPAYMPVPIFWAYFTGLALLLAGLAILINKMARCASLLLALLIFLFIVMIHVPGLFAEEVNPMVVANLLKDTALMGAALMVAGMSPKTKK